LGPDLAILKDSCSAWEDRADPAPLADWLTRELDHDGSPKRLPTEEWGRCLDCLHHVMTARQELPGDAVTRIEGLFEWLVHATRPDASIVFGTRGGDPARAARLLDWASLTSNPALASVVGRWFPTPQGRKPPAISPPLPAYSDEDRVLAILRPDWTTEGDWVAVDHRARGDASRVEVSGGGRPWLMGSWTSLDRTGPTTPGPAAPTSWSTGAYADALEWTFRAGPTRITRTAVLLRYRQIAVLAQQEDGPTISTGFRVGLADGTTPSPLSDLRAWSLARSRSKARLIPLALPALPYLTERGSFTVEAGEAVLRQTSAGRRRWLPLVVSWGKSPVTWRVLTVTEKSKVCPHDVAFGARVSWGTAEDGLLIYRSLGRPALRVVLGHQTRARFLIGRFTPDGNVVPLLSLD
jgi:hypothetical protein